MPGKTDDLTSFGRKPTIALIGGGGTLHLSNAGAIIWQLIPGVAPFVAEFTVANARGIPWLAKTRGEYISLNWRGRVFQKLLVTKSQRIDPWHVMFRVADRRFKWLYPKIFGRHNMRRRSNDSISVQDALEQAGVDTTLSARDDLSTIAKEKYRPWSIKADGSPRTAKAAATLMMRGILQELGEEGDFLQTDLPDNGQIPDQSEDIGSDVSELGRMLQAAELNVTVDQDGKIRFYDPFALPTFNFPGVKAGSLSYMDMTRAKPKTIEVFAIAERDRRLVLSTNTELPNKNKADEKPEKHLTLRNVLPLPIATTIDGKELQPGTWVEVSKALQVWGITEQDVREKWFFGGEGLKWKYARQIANLQAFFIPLELQKINAILGHYRQTFQINPRYNDLIRSWKAETSTILDELTFTRQPSPAFTQWYELFPAIPLFATQGPADSVGQNQSSFEGIVMTSGGASTMLFDPPAPAPARVSIVDQDLGILRVDYHRSIDGSVAERIPSHVEGQMEIFDTNQRRTYSLFTRNMHLAEDHRFETVISVVEGTPNASEDDPLGNAKGSGYHKKTFTVQGRAEGPKLQIVTRRDTARFDEDGKLVNESINAIMRAEAISVAKSYDPRLVGVLTVLHSPSDRYSLMGHVKGIRFTRSPDGSEAVIIDASEPPPARNPIGLMPKPVQNYLQRVIPKES